MNKGLINKITNGLKQHSPELLISAGIAGMATSTVLAVAATPKALQLMEDKKAELGVTYLTKKESIQAGWKPYIPSIGLTIASATCIALGTSQSLKKNTALATMYALSETTLKEYQRKTVELVGEEKAKEIDREVAKARVRQQPIFVENSDSEYVINTGEGDTLIYDTLSGRYFRSSKNAVDRAVNHVNKQLRNEYIMTANDFYNELGIPTVGACGLIGWKSDKEDLEVRYDSDVNNNGQPYLILTYSNRPQPLPNYYSGY